MTCNFGQAALVCVWLLAAAFTPALAVQPDEVLSDPKLEQRARELSAELRCLVCQNQSIDDSEAPLARDLRILVRERLKAGDSDSEVRDFAVARYGEFVLLRPRLSAYTYVLWLAPLLLFALGVFLARRVMRGNGQAAMAPIPALTRDEEQSLRKILGRSPSARDTNRLS